MDAAAIEAIVSMLMDLREQDNSNIPCISSSCRKQITPYEICWMLLSKVFWQNLPKERLGELEAAKEELEQSLDYEKLSKPPKISTDFMTFWLHRFRKLDVTKQSHRKILIDTFIKAIYIYDDKMLLTFNYKDGIKTITFGDIKKSQNLRLLVRIWIAQLHDTRGFCCVFYCLIHYWFWFIGLTPSFMCCMMYT